MSSTAVVGSGTRIMSDSWIDWKPRMEDPSNPKPSSKDDSVSWEAGTVKCCTWPGRSQKRRSMNSYPSDFTRDRTSAAVSVTFVAPSVQVDGLVVSGVDCSSVAEV